ncbi:MAG: uncharacterized protein A8A55_3608, partial [Amphiamblys sp. WSBS2006]
PVLDLVEDGCKKACLFSSRRRHVVGLLKHGERTICARNKDQSFSAHGVCILPLPGFLNANTTEKMCFHTDKRIFVETVLELEDRSILLCRVETLSLHGHSVFYRQRF